MNSPTPGPASSTFATLSRDKADRFRSMGAFGKPAYQNHVQLRAMLRAKRGDKFANYLSRPSFDPDQGELVWTAEVTGPARRWSELSEDEHGRRALDLEVIRSGLLGFVQELRAQGGSQPGGAAAFATLLEQAMKVPADGDHLFFVGDQPIIAFWGFQDQDGRSVDPTFKAPAFVPGAAFPADGGAAVTGATVAPGVLVADPSKKRPWWWWALAALLALLLGLLLLRSCSRPEGGLMSTEPAASAAEAAPVPGDAASQPPVLRPDGTYGPAIGGGSGGTYDGGSSSGGTSIDGSRTETLPADAAGAASGANGAEGALNDTDAPKLDPAMDPSKDPSKDADKKPDPDAAKDPANDANKDPNKDPNKPDPSKKNDGKDDKKPPEPLKPADKQPLKLPENPADAKKLDFLQGDWKAGGNLADKSSKTPLDMGIKFDKDGKGEVTLRSPDGSTCKGAVQGQMNGGSLGISGGAPIACSNGTTRPAPKIQCKKDSRGETRCVGINDDGSTYGFGINKQ